MIHKGVRMCKLYSPRSHMSYYQILEVSKLCAWVLKSYITLKLDRHLSSIAAEMPVKFQSDQTNLNSYLMTLRFCNSGGKASYRLADHGPASSNYIP